MKKTITLTLTMMLSACSWSTAGKVSIERNDLQGSWFIDNGDDSVTIAADGTFMTYLHDRPATSGTWALHDNVLTLQSDQDAALNETYSHIRTKSGGLLLFDETSHSDEVWHR